MNLPIDVTLLVLFAALMHASWNAIVKSSSAKLLDTVSITFGAGLIGLVTLPLLPLPERAAWWFLFWSVVLHFLYFMALVGAYRWGDLSLAYPLMRGLAPLIVAVVGVFALDEHLTAAMSAGVFLISAGILVPAWWRPVGAPPVLRKGTLIALANAVVIASYTLVDGAGTRLSGNPISYCQWLFFLNAFPILVVALVIHGRGVWRHAVQRWKLGFAGAALTVGAYGIVLWAMTQAPVAAVAALRETSVVFAAVIGTALFKEQLGRLRVGGALLVAAGIVALRF